MCSVSLDCSCLNINDICVRRSLVGLITAIAVACLLIGVLSYTGVFNLVGYKASIAMMTIGATILAVQILYHLRTV